MVTETLIPFVKLQLASRIHRKSHHCIPDTILAEYEQFDDYLEMVIQFGVRRQRKIIPFSTGVGV